MKAIKLIFIIFLINLFIPDDLYSQFENRECYLINVVYVIDINGTHSQNGWILIEKDMFYKIKKRPKLVENSVGYNISYYGFQFYFFDYISAYLCCHYPTIPFGQHHIFNVKHMGLKEVDSLTKDFTTFYQEELENRNFRNKNYIFSIKTDFSLYISFYRVRISYCLCETKMSGYHMETAHNITACCKGTPEFLEFSKEEMKLISEKIIYLLFD